MKELNKLENTVAGWLKPLPHLPASATKWIATNCWWIELIGVVLLGFSGLALIGTLFMMLGLTATIFGIAVFNGFGAITALGSLAFAVASVVIMAMAITPLKGLKKKGWDFLFLALLLNCAYFIFGALVNFSFISFTSSLLSSAVGIAIAAYFLFEIRSYFVSIK